MYSSLTVLRPFSTLKWIFRKQPITSRFEQFECYNSRFFASFGIRLHICPQGQPIRCHRLFSCCCSSSHAEYFRLSSVRLSLYSIMTHTGVLDDSNAFKCILWCTYLRLFCEKTYRGSLIIPIPVSVHYFDAFQILTEISLRPYTNISSNSNSQNTNPMQNLLQNNPDLLRHLLLLRKYTTKWPRKIKKKFFVKIGKNDILKVFDTGWRQIFFK